MKKVVKPLIIVLIIVLSVSLIPMVAMAEGEKPVTVKFLEGEELSDLVSRLYDGTTDGVVTSDAIDALIGVAEGDDVFVANDDIHSEFAQKDAGENLDIYVTIDKLSGEQADEYVLSQKEYVLKGEIAKYPIEVTGYFEANDKVYDGKNQAAFGFIKAYVVNAAELPEGEEIKVVWQIVGNPDQEIFGEFSDEKVGQNKEVSVDPDALEAVILENEFSKNYRIKQNDEETWNLEITNASITPDTFTVKPVSNCTETGKPVEPKIIATGVNSGETLVLGQDYKVEFKNNIKPGKASFTVTGIGNYEGCVVEGEFNIKTVKTGDEMNIGLYLLMIVAASAVIVTVVYKKKLAK